MGVYKKFNILEHIVSVMYRKYKWLEKLKFLDVCSYITLYW